MSLSSHDPSLKPAASSNGAHPENGSQSDAFALARTGSPDPSRLLVEHLLTSMKDEGPEDGTGRRWSISYYAAIVRRRWLPMLLAATVVATAAAVELRPSDKLYGATSVMLLPARGQQTAEGSDPFGVLQTLTKAAGPTNPTTQIAIITSPGLVERAIAAMPKDEQLKGFRTTDTKIAANLAKVTAVSGDSNDIINITTNALDPKVAVDLANGLIDAYAARTQEMANQANAKNLVLLAQQVKDAYNLMDQAREDYRKYKTEHSVADMGTLLRTTASAIADLQAKSDAARTAVVAGVGDSAVQSDETRLKYEQELNAAKDAEKLVLRDFRPSSPEAVKAHNDVKDAQAALDLRVKSLLAINKAKQSDADKALSQAQEILKKVPAVEVGLDQRQDKVDQLSESYKQVYERYTALSLGQNQQIDTATALTKADEAFPASRSLLTIILVAFACGLAVAIIVAAILESTDPSLHSTDELGEVASAPLLGSLPLLKNSQERRLPQLQMDDAASAVMLEASRILRSNLLFSAGEPLRSVLITSANMGEGKSLTAYNLGSAMAFDGKRVLLLDCDLRRPAQHTLCDVGLEPGLSDILQGTASLDAALKPAGLNNLWVLPAGSLPSNPPELLGSEANRRLLDELRRRFDLVVLDSPPILSLADAQVLSSLADGVMLVVAADATPKQHVQRAESLLRHVGARVLGVAFNKVKHHQDAYMWGSYYDGDNNAAGKRPRALT